LNDLILCNSTISTRVRAFSDNIVRITHTPRSPRIFPADPAWLKDILINTDMLASSNSWHAKYDGELLSVINSKYQKEFEEADTAIFERKKIKLLIKTTLDEGFFGWGEWFNAFRREKSVIFLRNQESPAFLQHRQTYSNIPIFFSDRGYAFFFLNSFPSQWDLDPKILTLRVSANGGNLDYLLIIGKDPKETIFNYTKLTGRPPLLPKWAFGLWVTDYPQENQQKTLEVVKEHDQRKIPLDGVILDYHWEEKFHNFQWRKSLFPSPAKFIKSLHEKGIHLGLIFTPFVNRKSSLISKLLMWLYARSIPLATFRDDECPTEDYFEGKTKKYFANDDAIWWFGQGGMVDFTNPSAASWWNKKLLPLYQQGVDFFKNDDGEYLPAKSNCYIGLLSEEYHNLYGFYYGKTIYKGMAQLDDRRPIIYSRSVWAGSQRYPAMFLGDQIPNFENIRRSFRAGLNMSILGFNYWTADCFGLSGKTSPEMHMRYAQWALMVPIARYFIRPPHIDSTRYPWSHNEKVADNFRKYIELRYQLFPYYYSLAWNAYLTGTPTIRPLWLEFPDDKNSYHVEDQAMIGSHMMIAPVMTKNATKRKVYFPSGTWFDYWNEKQIQGPGFFEIHTPTDHLPLFLHEGAIIPFGPKMQHIPDDHRFDHLDIHFWGTESNSIDIYDDDGLSTKYQSDHWLKRSIISKESKHGLEVNISATGSFVPVGSMTCQYNFIFHTKDEFARLLINGVATQPENIDKNELITKISISSNFTDQIQINMRF
jgi:alpha-glucosidase (family GH31 glycosyl hydrolase)